MGMLNSILEKLGLGDQHKPAPTPASQALGPDDAVVDSGRPHTASNATTGPGRMPQQGAPAGEADFAARLDQLAATRKDRLHWRSSIIDLLKLLDLDSSLESRRRLASELHCPEDLMAHEERMNAWLHDALIRRLKGNQAQGL